MLSSAPNELRIDAAGMTKIIKRLFCAAASVRVELSRTREATTSQAFWELKFFHRAWIFQQRTISTNNRIIVQRKSPFG